MVLIYATYPGIVLKKALKCRYLLLKQFILWLFTQRLLVYFLLLFLYHRTASGCRHKFVSMSSLHLNSSALPHMHFLLASKNKASNIFNTKWKHLNPKLFNASFKKLYVDKIIISSLSLHIQNVLRFDSRNLLKHIRYDSLQAVISKLLWTQWFF